MIVYKCRSKKRPGFPGKEKKAPGSFRKGIKSKRGKTIKGMVTNVHIPVPSQDEKNIALEGAETGEGVLN